MSTQAMMPSNGPSFQQSSSGIPMSVSSQQHQMQLQQQQQQQQLQQQLHQRQQQQNQQQQQYYQQQSNLMSTASTLPDSSSAMSPSHPHPYGTTTSGMDTTTSYERSRSRVSSMVVSEEFIGGVPQPDVKYEEIPVTEEIVRHIPKREIVEIEKRVPRYEYEYVDRIVEVPQIHYIDKDVEITQIQEVVRTVPRKELVEVPREVVRHVPRIETVTVEKIVEVPGQIVEVPKPYTVENKVNVTRFQDKDMPVVVAQTVRPLLIESNEVVDVDVYEYIPDIIPVQVHVAKPVASQIVAVGATSEVHRVVSVPAAQYNTILRSINSHLGVDIESLPYLRDSLTQQVQFLGAYDTPGTTNPIAGVAIEGYNAAVTTTSTMGGGRITYRGALWDGAKGAQQTTTTTTTSSMNGGVPATYPVQMMMRDAGEMYQMSEGASSRRGTSGYLKTKDGIAVMSGPRDVSRFSVPASAVYVDNKKKRGACQC